MIKYMYSLHIILGPIYRFGALLIYIPQIQTKGSNFSNAQAVFFLPTLSGRYNTIYSHQRGGNVSFTH